MRITVGKKLAASFIIIVLLLLFTGIISSSLLSKSSKLLKQIIEQRETTLKILDLKSTVVDKRDALLNIIMFGQNDNLFDKYIKKYDETSQLLTKKILNLNDLISKSGNFEILKQNCDEFKISFEAESKVMDRALDIYRAKGKKACLKQIKGQLSKSDLQLDDSINLLKKESSERYLDAVKQIHKAYVFVIIFFLAIIIFAVIFSSNISNKMVSNIIYLTNSANEISLGSLGTPIEPKSDDELGELAEVFERMRLDIKKAVDQIKRR